MSRKTIIGIVLIIILFFLSLTVYFVVKLYEKDEAQQGVILSINVKDLSGIDINCDNEPYSIYKEDDAWKLNDAENRIDKDKLAILFTVSSNIMGQVIPQPDDIQTGLDASGKSIIFHLSDGEKYTLYAGNYNQDENFYYAKTDQNNLVYKMNVKTFESLFIPKNKIVSMLIYQIPRDDIRQIKILNNTNKPLILTKEEKVANGIKYNWRISSPTEEYVDESQLAKNLMPYLVSMTALDIKEMDAKNLEAYGLRKPHSYLQIIYEGQKEIKVFFGAKLNHLVYAKLENQNKIFLINESDISFMNMKIIDLIDKRVLPFTADKIQKVIVIKKGQTITLDRKRGYINNIEVASAVFAEALSKISNLSVQSIAEKTTSGSPLYTIRYEKYNGKADLIEFMTLPDDYLSVKINGKDRYVMNESAMDTLWKNFEYMVKNES